MLIILPYCHKDVHIVEPLLDWIDELGGCTNHKLLLCAEGRVSPDQRLQIENKAKQVFGHVQVMTAMAEVDGWPEGANYMFRSCTSAAAYMPGLKFFFWMEPDAIPLKEGWADQLEKEFILCKKPFMGDRVQVADVPLHMSGCGFYPNPLYNFAGEAYRAAEVAFDMAGKDQIVPRAHFTKLIEHAWKHPSFTDLEELTTQIRPEAVLFHASKDGSLIKLLRERKNLTAGRPPETGDRANGISARAENLSAAPLTAAPESKLTLDTPKLPSEGGGGQDFTTDIFIRTFEGDYKWLEYCLKSIDKFCSGFRQVFICSPQNPPDWMLARTKQVLGGVPTYWKVINEECEDHYLSQQITKLYADVFLDYQPDYILHVDSDNVFQQPTTPNDLMTNGKVDWYYTPYHKDPEANWKCWKKTTEKFMSDTVDNEFMRRFPIMIPRWLYPRLREFVHLKHGMIISQYIRNQPLHEFSEYNALGAYAFKFHQDKFNWIDTETVELPKPFARQFWSWGGLSPEVLKEIEEIFNGERQGKLETMVSSPQAQAAFTEKIEQTKKASVVSEVQSESKLREMWSENEPSLSSSQTRSEKTRSNQDGESGLLVSSDSERNQKMPSLMPSMSQGGTYPSTPETVRIQQKTLAAVPEGIKELPSGIWIIKDDTHIGKWVEQQERLDHDQNLLPFILPYIKEGDTVVDAGAFIGDHTIAYLRAVGHMGLVYAIEPNPIAMQCLQHNLSLNGSAGYRLQTFQVALGREQRSDIALNFEENNFGAAWIEDRGLLDTLGQKRFPYYVPMMPMDFFNWNPNFVKLDVEGCEVLALEGMKKTIERCHPILVIEVNYEALKRQGYHAGEIYEFLESRGYKQKILQENCSRTSPMYDLFCLPPKLPGVGVAVTASTAKEQYVMDGPLLSPPVTTLGGTGVQGEPVTSSVSACIEHSSKPLFDMLSNIQALKAFAETDRNHRIRVMLNLSHAGLTPRWPKKKKKHKKAKQT